jgi:hypothetical protein
MNSKYVTASAVSAYLCPVIEGLRANHWTIKFIRTVLNKMKTKEDCRMVIGSILTDYITEYLDCDYFLFTPLSGGDMNKFKQKYKQEINDVKDIMVLKLIGE